MHLEGPVGQPANDVDTNNGGHQLGDLPMGALLFCRFYMGACGSEANEEERIQHDDNDDRQDEAQNHGVADIGFLRRYPSGNGRPLDSAGVYPGAARVLQDLGIEEHREHDKEGHHPYKENGQSSVVRCAVAY